MKCVLMVALRLSLCVVFQVPTGKRHRQVRKNAFTQIWSELLTRFLIQEVGKEVGGFTPGNVVKQPNKITVNTATGPVR